MFYFQIKLPMLHLLKKSTPPHQANTIKSTRLPIPRPQSSLTPIQRKKNLKNMMMKVGQVCMCIGYQRQVSNETNR